MQIRLHQRPFRHTSSSPACERVTVTTATETCVCVRSWRYQPDAVQQATNNFLPSFSATLSFSGREPAVFYCSLSLVQEPNATNGSVCVLTGNVLPKLAFLSSTAAPFLVHILAFSLSRSETPNWFIKEEWLKEREPMSVSVPSFPHTQNIIFVIRTINIEAPESGLKFVAETRFWNRHSKLSFSSVSCASDTV